MKVADLYDAVTWQNLLPFTGPVMGYPDGRYAWPADAWAAFQKRPAVLQISVTADERYPVFDSEYGDADQEQVATAAANRMQSGQWTVIYSAQSTMPTLTAALKSKGQTWRDAQYWPEPGIYMHVADPSGNIAAGRWHPPVTPVAVQTQWLAGYDISECHGTYPVIPGPAPEPSPEPLPPLQEADVMFVAVATGPASAAPQEVIEPGSMFLVYGGAYKYVILAPADVEALTAKLGAPVALTCSFLANIPNMR